ncbi:type II toxin-antitoxin system RelE family toxin [Gordonibacter massiliensis (ex Traore et al. 2017)]|uniref:Addiction module toxin RelE n=1 Tax=Gordonibacter massiliensis (ex Traore et al. 2017) TaxID=1841863 RepID=A0A842JF81_9ACTN|nr:hypothetical protein [Gordonibacter massiliensis (ex Traore et al. 2017)]MBC2888598.1 hypothetical protein [Gordonibacter massiliensis (ex Traore et al. 2017)]
MSAGNQRFKVRFFNAAAARDYQSLDGSMKKLVDVGLAKLRVRADEIGKPLGGSLASCKELKYRNAGIRVVFRIVDDVVEILEVVEIVAIGRRDKGEVFSKAERRLERGED